MNGNNSGSFSNKHQQRRKSKPCDERLLAAFERIIPAESTVVDMGAGTGRYVRALRERGFLAVGIDGTPGVFDLSDGLVREVDLSVPVCFGDAADWAISIEVGEHIPPDGVRAYVGNLCNAARHGMIVSWAIPGQRGRGHVSCRPPSWVIRAVTRRPEWYWDVDATTIAREIAGGGWRKKLLIFRHKEAENVEMDSTFVEEIPTDPERPERRPVIVC